MSEKLIIVGVGLFSEVALAYFTECSNYEVVAFAEEQGYVDNKSEKVFHGKPVIPFEESANYYSVSDHKMFIAVGNSRMNHVRARLFREAENQGFELISYVHPGVRLWESNKVGKNCFIFEDNTIQPYVSIGDNVILWSGNHIGHHTTIGNHVFITSHVVVSGSCSIGDYSFLGVNSTIIDGITVASNTLVGAGSLIKKNSCAEELFSPRRTLPSEEKTRPRFFNDE